MLYLYLKRTILLHRARTIIMKRVILANSNTCGIYDYKKPTELTLVKTIECPENKLKDRELVSDRPGHYNTSSSARGTYEQASDPEKILIDNFAKKLADTLNKWRNEHEFHELVVIMPPHMEGLFLLHLDKEVYKMIKKTLQKNLMNLNQHELLHYLNEHL